MCCDPWGRKESDMTERLKKLTKDVNRKFLGNKCKWLNKYMKSSISLIAKEIEIKMAVTFVVSHIGKD